MKGLRAHARYSGAERDRIAQVGRAKGFDLFDRLGVNERAVQPNR
jgi:hypothetical protein